MNELEMPLFMFTYLLELAIQLNGFREKMDALCQIQTIVVYLEKHFKMNV